MRLIRTFRVFATLQASHMAFGYLFHWTESTTSHPSSPKWLDGATTHETRTDRMCGRYLRSPGGPCRVDVNVWWKFIVAFYDELVEDRLEQNSNVGGIQRVRGNLF
ncbi:hypothetical protein M405DRAFT_313075 [Rhizopogon salebrosus TDB-379]|nr:hypothetical protein M405DRAFT_313075 [Rhizopogon salebrosus TDB-379]